MIWPFGRRAESRENAYTDALVQSIVDKANGATTAAASATGALQAASGLVSRCFAAATVDGPANLTAAVTPAMLSLIGRALIRAGEIVMVVDVDTSGRVRLLPASDWDITGSYDPETWDYRVNLAGPSITATRTNVPAAAVLHPRFECDPDRPWKGIGPIQSAALAGKLSAETAAALADAESGPRGGLLPLPVDGQDPTITALKADIKTLRGRIATVESVKTMHPGAAGNAPAGDWDVKRIGANPPAAEVNLHSAATLEVLSACGVPPSLFAESEGAAQRESFRRLLTRDRATARAHRLGRVVGQAGRGCPAQLRCALCRGPVRPGAGVPVHGRRRHGRVEGGRARGAHGVGRLMDGPPQFWMPPPVPPIRACVGCGRGVYTGAWPPRCLDCIAGLRRPDPGAGLGGALAVLGALFDG